MTDIKNSRAAQSTSVTITTQCQQEHQQFQHNGRTRDIIPEKTISTSSRQTMPCQEIEEILSKYQKDEDKIENLLQQTYKQQNETFSDGRGAGRFSKFLSHDEAKERNKTILKELETVKGNLRSKAIFSPAEMQWEKICQAYQENPSLPIATWRCNHPVFV